ncbi:MAG: efflux RND transporter periplasmic adaptor subunit [Deltaproteobacteria bacterium]|nr:efflux RND transporter periplasmic adaptor subunit [Deltaproteobacteria bacterium]
MEYIKDENNPESVKKKWIKRIWGVLPALFLVFFSLVVVILYVWIKAESKALKAEKLSNLKQDRPAVNVVVLDLVPMLIQDRISLPGIIKPWIKLEILAEVCGKVTKKAIEDGTAVKKGDIIATIDFRDYENFLKSANASYNVALADFKRIEKLYKKQLSTGSEFDNALAQVENYKAVMDNAALNLDRCKIRAPLSGVVNRIFIEEGQYLNIADPVTEILQIDRVKVKVGIPESDVDAVRSLTDFDVTIDALDGKIFKGKKHFLSSTADSMARLYNLDLVLENKNNQILPDMFARVEIVKKEVPEGISVPLYAVISRDKVHIVYVINDDRAHSKKVELGLLERWRVEIKKGLKAGEKVIVVGHRSVNDGEKVNVVRSVKDPREILK